MTAASFPSQAPPTRCGGWRLGDPVGRRQFVHTENFVPEFGAVLPNVRIAYETWGELNAARDNAVLVLHALTGDTHVTGGVEEGHPTTGWWSTLVGPGCVIDTNVYYVVVPNMLGGCQGSTGPADAAPDGQPWGARFPYVTIRDSVRAETHLTDELRIDQWALVIGGSMGGMRALEWAISEPDRVARVAILASTAQATGDQIGWAAPQLAAIKHDEHFHHGDYYRTEGECGPINGLEIARQIAHMTYRSAQELDQRFGRLPQKGENPVGGGGRFAIESYLQHHGEKLSSRFDPNSYVVLTEAMNSHDVSRGRGGIDTALSKVSAQPCVVSWNSDRLFPTRLSHRIVEGLPHSTIWRELHSSFGHDGFLVETDELSSLLAELLSRS